MHELKHCFALMTLQCLFSLLIGCIPSFIICKIIVRLKERLAQPISSALPQHQAKAGTPTLGGLAIFSYTYPCVVPIYYFIQNKNMAILVSVSVLSMMIIYYCFAIGFRDDLIKITSKDNKGLKKRTKFLLLIFPILFLFYILGLLLDSVLWKAFLNTGILLLFVAGYGITDGLDGLLAGISLCGIIIHNISIFPLILGCCKCRWMPGAVRRNYDSFFVYQNWNIFGSLFTFFLFNRKPAKIFMGDCGSMALGAFFGLLYINSGYDPLYLCISIVPIINLIAVGLKIGLAKVGIRYKLMAPIHHEIEKRIGEVNTVRLLIGITILVSAYPAYLSYQVNQKDINKLPELAQAN